jgi:hypothetical protein
MDDEFSKRIVELYKQKQKLDCPSMNCKFLKNTVQEDGRVNSVELCFSISTLLLLHRIELTGEIINDLMVLIGRNMDKYTAKVTINAFEICHACSLSQLIDKEDIQ